MIMISKNKTSYRPPGKVLLTPSLQNESGVALVVALLLMLVIITLVPVAMQMTSGEFDRAQNFKESREAFFVAEAGLEHAKYLTEQNSLAQALAGPDNLLSANTSNASDDDDNGTFGVGTPFTGPDGNLYDEVAFNGKTYYIRAFDNNDAHPNFDVDRIIYLQSVGIVGDTITTVQAEVYNPPGVPISAVTTNGNLTVSGSSVISGTCGSVHANGNVNFTGSAIISIDATSSGTYSGGSETVGGTSGGGQPNIDVPLLNPADYGPNADYKLASDGNVYDKNGNVVGSSPWSGWNYSSPKWTFSGSSSDAINATYYVEGDTVISSSPGSVGFEWEVSVVATGFIEVSGDPIVENRKNASDPYDIQNLFMIAGTDLKYNGNASSTVEGLLYAYEQIQISGNPSIDGAVMAYDSTSVEGLVSQNDISGNPNINYGCGMTVPSGSVDIKVISWNEL